MLILGIAFLAFIKRNGIDMNVKAESKETFHREKAKGLSKSDVSARKQRVKILPLYQRGLYWIWFFLNISFFVLFPAVLAMSRGFLMKKWFISDAVLYFSDDKFSLIVIFFAGMFFGVSLSIGFSYITYTKTIAKADALYSMGSFQVYPKLFNFILALIGVVIMLPILIFSYNNYQYFTMDEMIQKPVFSFTEKVYPYSDIEYIEKKIYTDGEESIIAHLRSGKKIEIFSGHIEHDNPKLYRVIASYDLPMTETRVLPLLGKIRQLFSSNS